MTAFGKLCANACRDAVLDLDIASGPGRLGEPCGFQSCLDVHPEVDNIRNELCLRLRLVPTAQNVESDPLVVSRHKARNDGVQGPPVTGKSVGRLGVGAEKRSAIL